MPGTLVTLDLVGIFVFAISGALVGVNKRFDIFGVLVLAGVTGLGGGFLRDLLIDATPHGGHAETDLALLALFGLPRLETVLAAYDAESRLAAGWQERVELHQLAPLLLHVVLFGGSYTDAALRIARRYA